MKSKFKIGDQVIERKGSFIYKVVKLPSNTGVIIHGEILSTTNTHWKWLVGQILPLDPSTLILHTSRKKSHPLTNIFK